MGEMAESVVTAMVPTIDGAVTFGYHDAAWPVYLIDTVNVAAFKETHDGQAPGLVWEPHPHVLNMSTPHTIKVPRNY